jgi:hypothetical protein
MRLWIRHHPNQTTRPVILADSNCLGSRAHVLSAAVIRRWLLANAGSMSSTLDCTPPGTEGARSPAATGDDRYCRDWSAGSPVAQLVPLVAVAGNGSVHSVP